MQLPKQVQEAQERSDRAFEERQKANAPAQTPPSEPPTPDATPPDPTPPAEPPKAADPPREDWKAKYLTLQGMYNADVPRLHKDLKAANARVDELTAEVATLKAAKPSAPEPPKEVKIDLPQALIEAIGPEAADAIARIIEQRTSTVRDDIGKQLDPLKEKVDTNAKTAEQLTADRAADARSAFMGALEGRVPDWQAIDAREDWRTFLAERDPFARRVRQDLLTEAASEGDLEAVVAFFDAFKARAGLTKPAADPPPEPAKPSLAHLEVPAVAGRSSVPAVEKKTWTQKEIREFYSDVTKGVYPRERAIQIERDIELAHKEGRVR